MEIDFPLSCEPNLFHLISSNERRDFIVGMWNNGTAANVAHFECIVAFSPPHDFHYCRDFVSQSWLVAPAGQEGAISRSCSCAEGCTDLHAARERETANCDLITPPMDGWMRFDCTLDAVSTALCTFIADCPEFSQSVCLNVHYCGRLSNFPRADRRKTEKLYLSVGRPGCGGCHSGD